MKFTLSALSIEWGIRRAKRVGTLRVIQPTLAAALLTRHCADACGKVLGTIVVVATCSLLPACAATVTRSPNEAYAKEAWAYFKKKCDAEAGEKIYKTFTGVKSILVVKPLPDATPEDQRDQYWFGDPYSAPSYYKRAESAASILADPEGPISPNKTGRGFDFVESVISGNKGKDKIIIKYFYRVGARDHSQQEVDKAVSRFGISWEDISTREDRKYWVAGSRLQVIDLTDKSIVAERIGYFIEAGFGSRAGARTPWLTSHGQNTTCPQAHTYTDRWFILKALTPTEEKQDGK